MLRALRSVFASQSVTPTVVKHIMDEVTSPHNAMQLHHYTTPYKHDQPQDIH